MSLSCDELDDVLRRAERERFSQLELIEQFLSVPARNRRDRSTELRIKNAKFRNPLATLETFDWSFNAQYIDRGQMEELATGEFIRRKDNLVFVGQSGLGKSTVWGRPTTCNGVWASLLRGGLSRALRHQR